MNEQLTKYWEQAKAFWNKLTPTKRIWAGTLAGVVALSGLITLAVLRQDPMQILYSDLHSEDAKAITKKLGEKSIPYHLSSDSDTVSVPASKVHQARMELAKDGLPGQDVVGFEKFDGSTIGMSSYVQKIQYVRAVQGELTRSIQRLASVKSARVHLSVPAKKTFLEDEDPPKASVILELRPGQSPTKAETAGIAHLVASAVEGLRVNQITIVDTKGSFLYRPEDAGNPGLSTVFLEMQRSIESDYEKRIEELLVPVVGYGKVRAKVTAEIDSSRSTTTDETFDPDKAVARTTLKTDEIMNGQRPNPIGIPGSRSNLPGTENTNPNIPVATNSSEKNTTNSTYAIPRKVSVVDKPSGNIKRLTISVVVDGYYNKGTGTQGETFAPRTEEELKRLRDIAANAVGFDDTRRDSITVSSLPFKNTDVAPADEVPPGKWDMNELMKHGVRNGIIGLVTLLFFFLVLRPFLKWSTANELEKKIENSIPELLPKTVAELEKAVQATQLAAGGDVASVLGQADKAGAGAPGSSGDPTVQGASAEMEGQTMGANSPNSNPAEAILAAESSGQGGSSEGGGAQGEGSKENPAQEEELLRKRILELLTNAPKKGLHVIRDWLDNEGTSFDEAEPDAA